MDLHELPSARRRVQAVDVLRDDRVQHAAALELGERVVGAVGPLVAQGLEALAVEAPEALGLAAEDVDVGDRHRIDVLPQPRTRGTEVGDPGRHRDPRAGERDDRLRRADEVREALAHFPWK